MTDPARTGAHPDPVAALELVPLAGSERAPVPGASMPSEPRTAPPGPEAPVEATVVLRRRGDVSGALLSGPGLSPAEFARAYGADPADVAAATRRFTELGLRVVATDAGSRRIRLAGSVADVERVFGTRLASVELGPGPTDTSAGTPTDPSGQPGPTGTATGHRVRAGGLSIPADLDGIVTAVLGLDDRPQTRAQYRIALARAVTTSYTPVQLGTVYDFPAGTDGRGQTVAIIELGGGFDPADLATYFAELGLTTPSVVAVGVDGAGNAPGDPNGADGEVMLDIEVIGALAPGADIVVYFAPNTDAGFLDAVSQAAHATPTPVAISISWGQSEDAWTQQARTAMDAAFVDAAVLGVTVTVAAGDDGSQDRVADGGVHVDFPAASPHALACGGTRLDADPTTGRVVSETVWNNGAGAGATGGGFSRAFPRPDYQATAVPAGSTPAPRAAGAVTSTSPTDATREVKPGGPASADAAAAGPSGRGVPDVAAVADPRTGYEIRVDGRRQVIGGTSAVAPLWAALVARLAQIHGQRFGLIQPRLYAHTAPGAVADGFRDVTDGTNGAYAAAPGWDACTGLGVPIGSRLATTLASPAP